MYPANTRSSFRRCEYILMPSVLFALFLSHRALSFLSLSLSLPRSVSLFSLSLSSLSLVKPLKPLKPYDAMAMPFLVRWKHLVKRFSEAIFFTVAMSDSTKARSARRLSSKGQRGNSRRIRFRACGVRGRLIENPRPYRK